MLVATLSLTNCSKELENIKENTPNIKDGTPFELFANPIETKTVIDNFDLTWEGDVDAINVYHAVAGSSTYVNDGSFAIATADVATGRFSGTLAEEPVDGSNYDWYAFYPYVSSKTSPALDNKGYTAIGCKSNEKQTQEGNSSTAHLAGSNYPLYGKATNIAYNATPTISMEHLAAYVEFNVTNNSGSPLTISEIVFEAPETIVGTYYINFADPSNIVYTSSGTSYTSTKATLTVNNGAEIADKASAKFYIGIKPLAIEASAGSPKTLSITVNDYQKNISLTSNTNFPAGKVKKINFNYDKVPYVFTAEEFKLENSGIAAGDRIILTNGTTGSVSVMNHYKASVNSGNSYGYSTLSVTNDVITSTEDIAVLVVGKDGDYYTFYDEYTGTYINATSDTGNNLLKTSTSVDNYAKWTVSFSGDAAVITNAGKNTRNIIRYNSRFACYSSGQNAVYIFKKATPKVLDHIALSGTYPTVFYTDDTFDYSGLVVTAHFEDGTSTEVTPTSVSSPDMSTTGEKTVTVSYTYKEVTKEAIYNITVNPRPAFTVTLADYSTVLTEASAGAGVTLPSRAAVGDYTFEGWSETNVSTETSTAPTIIPAGAYNPTANVTLYPVYSKTSSSTGWVKTALDAVTEGVYIIYNQSGAPFNGNLSSGHGVCVDEAITFSGNTATSIPNGALEITFTAVTGGFTLYNSEKGYLYASAAKSGYLAWHNTETSYWLYKDSNWTYNSNSARLRSYGTNATGIRTYGNNNGDGIIQLIKKTTVSTTVYYSNPTV